MSVVKFAILLALCLVCAAEEPNTNAGVKSSNELAFKLYPLLAQNDSSVIFSPISIGVALAMTSLSAKGETARELSKKIWDDVDMTEDMTIHMKMKEVLETMRSTTTKDTKVRIANRLFADNSVTPLDEFTQKAERYYGVDLGKLDFAGKTSKSRKQLNTWIKKETNSKVKNLIPDGYISSADKLIVANALYFNGPWMKGFKGKETKDAEFHISKTKTVNVPLMQAEDTLKMAACKKLKSRALEMFYEGNNVSMIIVLPNNRVTLAQVESKLTYETYTSCLQSVRKSKERKIKVFLPKFKILEDTQLKRHLVNIGVKKLFEESNADLSGLSEDSNLKVDDVYHRSFISVGEKGNRPASSSVKGKPTAPEFKADNPFLFFIRDNVHGSIVLMGRVIEPLQKLKSLKKGKRGN